MELELIEYTIEVIDYEIEPIEYSIETLVVCESLTKLINNLKRLHLDTIKLIRI